MQKIKQILQSSFQVEHRVNDEPEQFRVDPSGLLMTLPRSRSFIRTQMASGTCVWVCLGEDAMHQEDAYYQDTRVLRFGPAGSLINYSASTGV